jgi:hypothetical protein
VLFAVCSNDLTQGLRSSARALTAAEQGVRQGVDLAGKAVTGYVVPKIKSTVPEARGEGYSLRRPLHTACCCPCSSAQSGPALPKSFLCY